MPRILFFFVILLSNTSSAQKIYGTVFSDRGDLLPYASVTIKGTSIGTSANDKAKFSFTVSPGTYTVVCQHIGYKTQEKVVTVKNEDAELTFIIAAQQLDMTEVVVKSGQGELGLNAGQFGLISPNQRPLFLSTDPGLQFTPPATFIQSVMAGAVVNSGKNLECVVR